MKASPSLSVGEVIAKSGLAQLVASQATNIDKQARNRTLQFLILEVGDGGECCTSCSIDASPRGARDFLLHPCFQSSCGHCQGCITEFLTSKDANS